MLASLRDADYRVPLRSPVRPVSDEDGAGDDMRLLGQHATIYANDRCSLYQGSGTGSRQKASSSWSPCRSETRRRVRMFAFMIRDDEGAESA